MTGLEAGIFQCGNEGFTFIRCAECDFDFLIHIFATFRYGDGVVAIGTGPFITFAGETFFLQLRLLAGETVGFSAEGFIVET